MSGAYGQGCKESIGWKHAPGNRASLVRLREHRKTQVRVVVGTRLILEVEHGSTELAAVV